MNKPIFVLYFANLTFLLSSCAMNKNTCEEIVEINAQLAQCQILEQQIKQTKNKNPILASELERRHQQDCVDIRYYRDEHQDAVCDNKDALKQISN